MHELSIAQSILSIAERAIPLNEDVSITGIGVQIGELSGIEISSLEFALSIIKKDTVFEDADVTIEVVKGEARCTSCNTVFPISFLGTCCPNCNGYSMNILKGKEMRVLNIVVDE